jgi:hypothetical protein
MLTKEQALTLVSEKLRQMSPQDDEFVIVDAASMEKPYGWVFFYNSKTYLETGEIRYALAGNGPVVVNKYAGMAEFFGASRPPLAVIAEYEQKLATGDKP